ncbi:B12-binding domain-containing radical SAM protein [Candidatus Thorarchaeota archaeon]|nr:MAG: B12-binding domain-containing radical SAM protein [Candidatus Thorarchaeota archaeon]
MTNRVLIVDALSAGTGQRRSSRDSIGCGPRAVAGVLENNDIPCQIHRVEEILEKRAILRKFDHAAISAMTMDLPAVTKFVKLWYGSRTHGRLLIGGPISADPLSLIELNPDVIVIGEGEATLEELVTKGFLDKYVELSEVRGVAYPAGGKIVTTKPRDFIPSKALSDDYRPSTTRIIDYRAYQASKVYVEVTRGCSNFRRTNLRLEDGRQCSDCGNCDADDPAARMNCPEDIPPGCGFCSVPGTWGPPRSRTTEVIVEEVRELLDLGVHRIVLESPGFLDFMRGNEPLTDPCYPPANLNAIRDLLERLNALPQVTNKTAHIAIENMKACLFTEDVAKTLVDSMMSSSPNIGLETGSEKHLRDIGKCGSPGDVISAVRIATKYGMNPFVYFIYGLPGEDEETITESIEVMREVSKAGAERIILYGFRPLPGSAFEKYPESSTKDELGLLLRQEADKINREKKDNYLGKILRGIAAEPSWVRHGYTMVNPLEEGPLMTVPGGYSPGTLLDVRVSKVLSSGLVAGEVVQPDNGT